jgi:hypothetical protein
MSWWALAHSFYGAKAPAIVLIFIPRPKGRGNFSITSHIKNVYYFLNFKN